jgi:flagellar motor protein MotB
LEVLKFLSTRVQPPLPLDLTTANGRADTDPIGPDKAKNRRIEILIIFSDDQRVRR